MKDKNTIPAIGAPNTREMDRMINELERRVMIIGRDQRTFAGVNHPAARVFLFLGWLIVMLLMLLVVKGYGL